MLSSWILRAEAEHCRLLAAEFAGRPEALVSLRLASAFEDLGIKSGMAPPRQNLVGAEQEPDRSYLKPSLAPITWRSWLYVWGSGAKAALFRIWSVVAA